MDNREENLSTMEEVKKAIDDTSASDISINKDVPFISNRSKKRKIKESKRLAKYLDNIAKRDTYRTKKRLARRIERLNYKKARNIYFQHQ